MIVTLLYFLALFTAVLSTSPPPVTVLYPLDDQLPFIARVNNSFSWTFSPSTFGSSDGSLRYSTSSLPAWLSFDDSTRTFHGIPSTTDEGYPEITVSAHGSSSSTSSKFTLCVTHTSPPTSNLSLWEQFREDNPSMSSVFFLRPGSALATPNPTVRIPPEWSFSIGFDTFISGIDNVFYELRQANGSDIPEFMDFNSKTITLNGAMPSSDEIPQPVIFNLALHVSDQEGYTASIVYFDVVLAAHELSLAAPSLPTINITASAPFAVSLLSSVDFTGCLVDGDPIQPSNISLLEIDVSGYKNWLRYDPPSRTLSGSPGGDAVGANPLLPVTLHTFFNQTIYTNMSFALVPSYFVMPDLPSLHVSKGDDIQFNLGYWFSNASQIPDDANITVAFEPNKAANWLRYDQTSTNLTGTVPLDYDDESDHVSVVFTAYCRATRSTSHANLTIFIVGAGHKNYTHPRGLSAEAHRRLVLALAVTFGMVGGIALMAGLFAVLRKWVRVEDTAVLGEEGRHAWSEKDRRWYGMTLSPRGTRIVEKSGGYQPSSPLATSPVQYYHPSPSRPNYGQLGLGLRRVSERSQSESNDTTQSPGVMSKRDFISKIKETVRKVSDKCSGKQRPSYTYDRPVIGKPILITSPQVPGNQAEIHQSNSPVNPFETIPSRPGSTFMTGSPSNSTGEHSIPRRRPDFAPPRNLAQVHFADGRLTRQVSAASMGTSVMSGRSGVSGESLADMPTGPPGRPRLVPFTSSTRVPVPQVGAVPGVERHFAGNRVTSQQAKVCKVNSQNGELDSVKPSGSNDELIMGIHYVRSLGADQLAVNGGVDAGSSPAVSNVRSSFTSLESSHAEGKSGSGEDLMKVLVRCGESFKFRVPVPEVPVQASKQTRGYHIRLTSGQPLPKFMHGDLSGISKGVIEFSGMATFKEIGETVVGIYAEKDGLCVTSVVIEVVGKR